MSTQRRWFSLAIGILFGAFDFYYHRLISDLTGGTVWFVLSLGIWLVPLLPIALHEARIRTAIRCRRSPDLVRLDRIVLFDQRRSPPADRPSEPSGTSYLPASGFRFLGKLEKCAVWRNPHRRRHIRMDRICRCGRARHRLGSWCRLSLQKKKRASAPFAPE